jgi:phospholipase/lecithinase/hemolysin
MQKINLLLVSIIISLSSTTAIASTSMSFDRAIFFGDSLSDIGNFPEPKNYLPAEKKDIPLYNLYVPVSNPVNSDLYGKSFDIPDNTEVKWLYPNKRFLNEATTFEGLIDNNKRTYKSINWIEYLVYNNFSKNLLTSSAIYRNNKTINKNISIDYAWVGALSIDGFGDEDQNTVKGSFGQNNLLKIKDKYTADGGQSSDIIIPGVMKQVEYHIDNLDKGLVPKDSNTAYFILVGGNDISETLKNDLLGFHLKRFLHKIGSTISYGTIAKNVKASVDMLINKAGAKHIYVLTLLNVANLPTAYHQSSNYIIRSFIQGIIKHTVNSYNKQLSKIFSTNEYNNVVTLLPIASQLNELAKEGRFSYSVDNGLTCIDNMSGADSTNPNINNCNYDNDTKTYFAWNNSHLSTIVNQFMAYEVISNINNQNQLKLDTDDSQDQKDIAYLISQYNKFIKYS